MVRTPTLPEVEMLVGSLVIADLHLDLERDDALRGFLAFLEAAQDAPRLLILGDLFEYWIGGAQAESAGGRRVLAALGKLTRSGSALDVVPGNRDFLLDDRFERASGARLRRDGLVGVLGAGERVLFLHGDELCSRDRAYLRLRGVLRSPLVSFAARALPAPAARALARHLRRTSRAAVAAKPAEVVAQQPEEVRNRLGAARAQTLVCGHAHRFRDERLDLGLRWIVLDAFGAEHDVLAVGESGLAVGAAAALP
jgi:UDP-2,3-diacylglucosamine hydrolase